MIEKVSVNHEERNYFDDYTELRTDQMVAVTPEKIARAVNKLVRRHRGGHDDFLFVTCDDDTGWRLGYDYDPNLVKQGVFDKCLRLTHYTHMSTDSWDSEENVSAAYALRAILGS